MNVALSTLKIIGEFAVLTIILNITAYVIVNYFND